MFSAADLYKKHFISNWKVTQDNLCHCPLNLFYGSSSERHSWWLVGLGLTALWDSISVCIGPSPRESREREEEERNDRSPNNTRTHCKGSGPTIIHISSTPSTGSFTQHHRTTTILEAVLTRGHNWQKYVLNITKWSCTLLNRDHECFRTCTIEI